MDMKKIFPVLFIIFSAVLLRLFPHVPNFAPVGAMALFGGAYLAKKYAVGIVFLTLLLSDYLLLYIHPFSAQFITLGHVYPLTALIHGATLYVYGSFLLAIGIGMWVRKHQSIENIMVASITSSLLFFFITNFGVWVGGMYARNMSGLWESYIMGLPFLRATVFGDLFYNGLFFSSYYIIAELIEHKKTMINNSSLRTK